MTDESPLDVGNEVVLLFEPSASMERQLTVVGLEWPDLRHGNGDALAGFEPSSDVDRHDVGELSELVAAEQHGIGGDVREFDRLPEHVERRDGDSPATEPLRSGDDDGRRGFRRVGRSDRGVVFLAETHQRTSRRQEEQRKKNRARESTDRPINVIPAAAATRCQLPIRNSRVPFRSCVQPRESARGIGRIRSCFLTTEGTATSRSAPTSRPQPKIH